MALIAKAGFLFLVAPHLPPGEFSSYVFLSTVALLAARLLSCGMSDQLVIELRGSRAEAARYTLAFRALFGVAILFFVATAFASGAWRAVALSIALVGGSMLEGLLRACAPSQYERLTNLAPMLFLGGCLAVSPVTSSGLVTLFVFSTLLSQVVTGVASKLGFIGQPESSMVGLQDLIRLARRGFGKMVAEFTLLANIRAVLIWPKIISGKLASDSLAFAITIAEAVSTLPMVVVNRNYARFAASPAPTPAPRWSPILAIVFMAVAALGTFLIPSLARLVDLAIFDRLVVLELASALLFLGAVTAYYDLRYHAWSQGAGGWVFAGAQALFLCLQGLLVWLVHESFVLLIAAVAGNCCVLAWMARSAVHRSNAWPRMGPKEFREHK